MAFPHKRRRGIDLALALCFLGSVGVAQEPTTFDERWRRCHVSLECTAVEGVCGEAQCVNRRFSKKVSRYYEAAKPFVECNALVTRQKVAAVCEKNQCRCQDLQ